MRKEIEKIIETIDIPPLECYSCGEPIKRDKEDRPECYCNDCESLDTIHLKQENKKLKEQLKEKLKLPEKKDDVCICSQRTKEMFGCDCGAREKNIFNQAIDETIRINGLNNRR